MNGESGSTVSSPPKEVLGLIALALTLLLLLQYRTLPKLSALAASYSALRFSRTTLSRRFRSMARISYGSLAFFICLATMVLLEWRWMSLTKLLRWIFATERRTWIAIMMLAAMWVRYYWALGEGRWVGDSTAHLAYMIAAVHAIKSFELPIWSNLSGVGTPYLQYYGFLYFLSRGSARSLCPRHPQQPPNSPYGSDTWRRQPPCIYSHASS